MYFSESELILNPDGSIYHLNMRPEQLADTVITVGDPDRVEEVTKYFDCITDRTQHREFVAHTGFFSQKRITVISTGIGTDNIDIVLNELDALANIDFATRTLKPQLKSLNIIRIGTSGCVQADIPLDTILATEYAFGMDALGAHYAAIAENPFGDIQQFCVENALFSPKETPQDVHFLYGAAADKTLLQQFAHDLPKGFTVTAPGFYAPQGRFLRTAGVNTHFIPQLAAWRLQHNHRITNLEMETAGIYALANIMGHKALSINALLANRITKTFSKQAEKTVDKAIQLILERV
ncbi:MAG: hypothetical protein RI894_1295 [Bacteroidota bacterium]|jgi:uridine phosphorylase